MNEDDIERYISDKQDAVRDDAFVAKQRFDMAKDSLKDMSYDDLDDSYSKDVDQLRHEMKLLMAFLSSSKFDDIIHLLANPSRLLGLNFVIGFVRGLGFILAVVIILMVVLVSLSDTAIFDCLK